MIPPVWLPEPRSRRSPIRWPGLAQAAVLAASLLAAAGPVAAADPPVAASAPASAAQMDKQDYSAAERLLFMSPQLAGLRPPHTLRYRYIKSGTMEPGFDDQVSIVLKAQADGSCCSASAEFQSGEKRLGGPEVPGTEGNPLTLYFLEHDVREMQRLTRGSQNHFRKLIRIAVYNRATVRDVSVRWRGQTVNASEIVFSPFLDDVNRPKYERFVRKSYRFVLSDAVPGGIYAIRTRIDSDDTGKTAPLLAEALYVEGAETLTDPPARTP